MPAATSSVINRLKLYASTCRLISVFTRSIPFVRKCVAPPHPRLDGPERMLDRATSDAHSISTLIKLHLHVVEHILMLPVTRRCWLGVHLSLSGQPLQFEL